MNAERNLRAITLSLLFAISGPGSAAVDAQDVANVPSLWKDSLGSRDIEARNERIKRMGGNRASERAVAAGLKWIVEHQLPDGGWSFDHRDCPTCHGACPNHGSVTARNAATAIALLPLLASGACGPDSDYQHVAREGLEYLIAQQAETGSFSEPGGTMYSHGLSTMALCEACQLVDRKTFQQPAQAALDFIVQAQDPAGGGWRYLPCQGGDTSVTGWQIQALQSGLSAGLEVPQAVLAGAVRFLDSVATEDRAGYGYLTPTKRPSTTAIGLLCRLYLGWPADHPALQKGWESLRTGGPSSRDMYYNFHASQVLFQADKQHWKPWNRELRKHLIQSQAKEGHATGSWYFGESDFGAGRLYCTALATLNLQVYYRHARIFDDAAPRADPVTRGK